ncbi:hypothetical protein CM15mP37_11660 [bacterium]|nr:MAG: hypothetical protein CM15mP37_11660 [bacterium]
MHLERSPLDPADKIFDLAGNGNEAISFIWTYDGTAPSVSSVTALVADGSYIEGKQIPIALIFTENVVVTDTPFLSIESQSQLLMHHIKAVQERTL